MANRNYANGGKIWTMSSAYPVLVNTNITIGAAGAVTASTSTGTVPTVTHTSTGIYTLSLASTYNSAVSISGAMQSPVSGLSGITTIECGNAPSTTVSTFGSPTIVIKCLNPSGALADPATGSTISVTALLNNSSVVIP
jgi:hypothetical protein